ncbi:semaphorin-3F isoform X2 [Acipenser ruthenus]|uniref:semaphorin-3F isoform X2 n=1 Tax=Acipenser ruthenus TaxID=7906 RepID=UPI0027416C3E|nr:semaphorin-3F isoform X2 [Acipenser ruthenus]
MLRNVLPSLTVSCLDWFVRPVLLWRWPYLSSCWHCSSAESAATGSQLPECTCPTKIHWPATEQRLEECRMAGKGEQGECANYVRLIAPWNRTHLYTCGTGAYSPVCSFINRGWRSEEYLFRLVPGKEPGKGKCPYDPRQETVATLINGNLYAGVQVDFMGMDTAIFRTLGRRPAVRTEQYDSRWLNEPVFIKIHMTPDSSEKNDDKLYFFFREKSLESGSSPSVLSRVGRVCLNDDGGQRSLVNKWTTFLKARLVCSVVGGDGVETYFDELRDVFIQPTQDERNPMVYAVFSTSGSVFTGSAVCVYSMADIRNVFNGPFSHKQGHNYQWAPYTGKIPYPRPGTCPGGTFTPGVRTTKDFSDEVVNFVRAHPLMYTPVYPVNRRPLVVRTGVDYRFTTIAVDLVDAVDGRYEVLFLGTDRGTVQKLIVLPKDPSTTEELTLEEVEVFKTSFPVKTMKISSKRQQLYVSSDGGLTQMSLHRCGVYGKACSDCCLARDPYCAWDGENCAAFPPAAKRRSRRQDIKHGDPLRQCRGFNAKVEKRLRETTQFGVEGSSTFLECQPRSPQASVKWLFQKDGTSRRKMLIREKEVLKTGHGVLLRSILKSDSGLYHCVATENNFKHTVARVALRVLDREIVDALTTSDLSVATSHSPPQTLPLNPPHLIGQPEIRLINQYCDTYWDQLNPALRPRRTSRHDAKGARKQQESEAHRAVCRSVCHFSKVSFEDFELGCLNCAACNCGALQG